MVPYQYKKIYMKNQKNLKKSFSLIRKRFLLSLSLRNDKIPQTYFRISRDMRWGFMKYMINNHAS